MFEIFVDNKLASLLNIEQKRHGGVNEGGASFLTLFNSDRSGEGTKDNPHRELIIERDGSLVGADSLPAPAVPEVTGSQVSNLASDLTKEPTISDMTAGVSFKSQSSECGLASNSFLMNSGQPSRGADVIESAATGAHLALGSAVAGEKAVSVDCMSQQGLPEPLPFRSEGVNERLSHSLAQMPTPEPDMAQPKEGLERNQVATSEPIEVSVKSGFVGEANVGSGLSQNDHNGATGSMHRVAQTDVVLQSSVRNIGELITKQVDEFQVSGQSSSTITIKIKPSNLGEIVISLERPLDSGGRLGAMTDVKLIASNSEVMSYLRLLRRDLLSNSQIKWVSVHNQSVEGKRFQGKRHL